MEVEKDEIMQTENKDELLQEMTQALQDAIEVQDKYSEALKKLQDENRFLADTIEQNKLGKLTVERKNLLERAKKAEVESRITKKDFDKAKSEYEQKYDKLDELTKIVKTKQTEVDAIIEQRAEEKIAKEKERLVRERKKQEREFKKHVQKHKMFFIGSIALSVIELIVIIALLIC